MERENQDLALEQIKLKAAEQQHMDTEILCALKLSQWINVLVFRNSV